MFFMFTKIKPPMIFKIFGFLVLTSFWLLLRGVALDAQFRPPNAPDIGTITKEALEARPKPAPELTAPEVVIKDHETSPNAIYVKEFKLENLTHLNEATVQKVLEPYKGKNLTPSQLNQALAKVVNLYREKGYVDSQVYLVEPLVNPSGVVVVRVEARPKNPKTPINK